MLPITMTITAAGLDALVNAEGGLTEAIVPAELGLSETAIDPAPTIVALPGEFKRIAVIHGAVVAPNMIHVTAQDASLDTYDLRSLAIYLDDGTLFAVYGQPDPLFSKVSIATFLFAQDIAFSSDIAGAIDFGDANFLYPPATETEKGVAQLATQAHVDAGDEADTIVTPATLAVRLAALLADVDADLAAEIAARIAGDDGLQDLIAALQAITITGTTLATGGGNLLANRQIDVARASGADTLARLIDTAAVTPLGLASLLPVATVTGGVLMFKIGDVIFQAGAGTIGANSNGSVTFPVAYTSECFFNCSGGDVGANIEGQVANSSNTLTGGSIVNSGASGSNYSWYAVGR